MRHRPWREGGDVLLVSIKPRIGFPANMISRVPVSPSAHEASDALGGGQALLPRGADVFKGFLSGPAGDVMRNGSVAFCSATTPGVRFHPSLWHSFLFTQKNVLVFNKKRGCEYAHGPVDLLA